MAKTVDITIKFKVSELKKMIDYAGLKVVDKTAFAELVESDKFKKVLATDILDCYRALNDEDSDGVASSVELMFGDVVGGYDD